MGRTELVIIMALILLLAFGLGLWPVAFGLWPLALVYYRY
mgnify:CR=1 FL=1